MATSGPNFPTTAVDDATQGTLAWTNPGNVMVEDGIFATRSVSPSTITHFIKTTGYGFSIPAGATIDGILAEVKVKGADTQSTDSAVKIVQGGTIGGTDQSTNVQLSTTLAYRSFGGAANLWGLTWTDTDINSSGFGFCYSVRRGTSETSSTASVDAMRLTVYYTPSGGGSVQQSQTRVMQAINRAATY